MERTARILVADDEKGMREGCRRVLLREGYEVETAEDGERALELARATPFDLLLVDLKMPRLSGMELLQQVQQMDPTVVSIVITGYATLANAVEATKSGAYDFLPKPFSPAELAAKVAKGLERRWLILESRRLREERERRLLEISAEKSRLLTIINCMLDGVLATNRDRQLVLYNPAALSMLRLSGQNLVGQPLEGSLPVPELVRLLQSAIAPTERDAVLSESIPGPDGGTVLMANVAPIRDEKSEVLGAVAVLRDITELKRLDRMKSQFVAMVSHELKSPLAAVQSYMDVILSGAVGEVPEPIRRIAERSKERTSGLVNLINDLLDISSAEAGRIARRLESLQISGPLSDAVEVVRSGADAAGITITQNVPPDLPPVRADSADMGRLFANLLTNAVKYNRPGGSVHIAARVEGSFLRVDVADTGIGIAKESIPRLFEEFYRVVTPETRQVSGTGLGLAIVKKIVEAHHGFVKVDSEVGKGSTFSVFLPLAKEPPASPPAG